MEDQFYTPNNGDQPVYQDIPPVQQPVYQDIPPVQQPVYQDVPPVQQPVYQDIPPVQQPVYQETPPVQQPVYQEQQPVPPVPPAPPAIEPEEPEKKGKKKGKAKKDKGDVEARKLEPITPGGFIGIWILLAIPVLNILLTIIWACGGCRKINKRNMARGILILWLIGILLVIVAAVVGIIYFGGVDGALDALKSIPELIEELLAEYGF